MSPKKNMLPCELLVNQVPGDGVNHSKKCTCVYSVYIIIYMLL